MMTLRGLSRAIEHLNIIDFTNIIGFTYDGPSPVFPLSRANMFCSLRPRLISENIYAVAVRDT